MYALVFALLCGTARAQVLQGCFLKTDPPISLTSRSMDPSLCQKRCPSSRYILLAPTLNDEFNFMCSCAANLPTSVSGSCNMPCPGTFGPSAGVLCGGYRFSQTSVGWSGYAVVQGGPAPPVVQPVVPSQAPVPPAPPVQVETAAASIAPSPVVPVPMPPAQVETAIISTVPSLAIVSPPIQSEPTATVGPAASTSNVVITSLQAASSQSTVTAGPVASQPSTALISTMTTDSSAVHAETASTFTSTTAPSNSSDVSTQAFQQANTLPLQTLLSMAILLVLLCLLLTIVLWRYLRSTALNRTSSIRSASTTLSQEFNRLQGDPDGRVVRYLPYTLPRNTKSPINPEGRAGTKMAESTKMGKKSALSINTDKRSGTKVSESPKFGAKSANAHSVVSLYF